MQYQRPVPKYYIAVVFVDYLTKRPEICATFNQSAYTIAKLLVEKFVSSHGVPSQLLSDHIALLSKMCYKRLKCCWGFTKSVLPCTSHKLMA